ncbi:hypothetical protein H5410_009673 [Solanum commersonii]|uniref:Uncharacterized protein n=1 Tax=Solanum commersonii TaxID=4109 RepID=A0A9J6AKB5_SOLCO|nr:hypothetical protein H5410_009673 [Solanum commersonii]
MAPTRVDLALIFSKNNSSLSNSRRGNEMMRLLVTTIVGVVIGIFLGVSFPTLSLTKARELLWLLNLIRYITI